MTLAWYCVAMWCNDKCMQNVCILLKETVLLKRMLHNLKCGLFANWFGIESSFSKILQFLTI